MNITRMTGLGSLTYLYRHTLHALSPGAVILRLYETSLASYNSLLLNNEIVRSPFHLKLYRLSTILYWINTYNWTYQLLARDHRDMSIVSVAKVTVHRAQVDYCQSLQYDSDVRNEQKYYLTVLETANSGNTRCSILSNRWYEQKNRLRCLVWLLTTRLVNERKWAESMSDSFSTPLFSFSQTLLCGREQAIHGLKMFSRLQNGRILHWRYCSGMDFHIIDAII